MNFNEQVERYQSDPDFHTLVDLMYQFLMQGKFSITEFKDAAVFASNKFAMEQVSPASRGYPGVKI